MYASNNTASTFMKQKLVKLSGEIDNFSMIMRL